MNHQNFLHNPIWIQREKIGNITGIAGMVCFAMEEIQVLPEIDGRWP